MINKNLYIIAGCNGAGKTTASFTILPNILNCKEFINADEIAKGLSPFQPEKVAFEAGRIMLRRIKELLLKEETFALETTLATKSYHLLIKKAQAKNYNVTLLFFWLPDVYLAIERVRIRVSEGGHNIATDIIVRRYTNGIKNLFKIYMPIVNEVLIFDNAKAAPVLIAEKLLNTEINIINKDKFKQLKAS